MLSNISNTARINYERDIEKKSTEEAAYKSFREYKSGKS
jgi:hypothetical protein